MKRLIFAVFLMIYLSSVSAMAMGSTNFSINSDIIGSGGDDYSSSTAYKIQDTIGEQATGDTSSTNFQNRAGYRAIDVLGSSSTTSTPPGGGGGGGGNNNPPIISGIQVINITTSSASIVWSTNVSADSAVEYGLTNGYGSGTASDSGFVFSHQINLSQLSPGTTYHFRIFSKDTSANQAVSLDNIFTTLNVGSPVVLTISNIILSGITSNSAQISWTTNVDANGRIDYGTSTSYGLIQTDQNFIQAHSMLLTGLSPQTSYHFNITSMDATNDVATSSDGVFLTASDTTPPANVANFTAIGGDAKVDLSWSLPNDPGLAGVRIVRKTGGYPAGSTDGVVVYVGMGTATTDSGVTNGTTYYYGAFAFDASNNFSSGALADATPNCTPYPACASPTPTPTSTNQQPPPQPAQPPAVPGGQPIPVVPQPTAGGRIVQILPQFFSAQGLIEFVPDSSGQFGGLEGTPIAVIVPVKNLGATPDKAYVTVDGSTYQLIASSDSSAYQTSFIAPPQGIYAVTVSMSFVGGGAAIAQRSMLSQPSGRVVLEDMRGLTQTGIPDATVTLFVSQGGGWVEWNGAAFGQKNPVLTNTQGGFSFIVPNGRYYAEVSKSGYQNSISNTELVEKGVFAQQIGLIALPLPITANVSSSLSVSENAAHVVQNISSQATFAVTKARTFLASSVVQQTVKTGVSPTLLGVALVNVATSLPMFNVLAYLQYFFTQPILLISKRRRKKWGIVYNSLTKQPLELAIVRLVDAKAKTVLQTRVTDKFGRYAFTVSAGQFLLEVVKPGFAFPSKYLQGKSQDVDFVDLYFGAPLTVTQAGMLALNLPIDPTVAEEPPKSVLRKEMWRRLQRNLATVTVVAALIAFVIAPSVATAVIASTQVIAYLVFRRLAMPAAPKPWGAVIQDEDKKPLSRVIVRIFDKKFNKLLETQVTDASGRYGFFARRNIYYITAEKERFQKYFSPDIDLTAKDEGLVDQNVGLKKA